MSDPISKPEVLIVDDALEARAMVPAPSSLADFMVMAGGQQQVCLTQNGKPLVVVVDVTPASATALNAQLTAVAERTKQKPYFGFDHKKDETRATAWPTEFYWNPTTGGLHARTEPSAAGTTAVEGKDYRGFSMVFHVDDVKKKPAQIVCNPKAGLNMGGLTNEPAFHENAPLWAREAQQFPGACASGANGLEAGGVANQQERESMKKTIEQLTQELATLQANHKTLEQQVTALKARSGDAAAATELQAREAQLDSSRLGVQLAEAQLRNAQLEAREQQRKETDAKAAVAKAVSRGVLPAQNTELQAQWTNWCTEKPEMISALEAMEANQALQGRITQSADARQDRTRVEARDGAAMVIKGLGQMITRGRGIRGMDSVALSARRELSQEMSALYARDVSGKADVLNMPLHAMQGALEAATAADTIGTLTGTLVVQRTLEFFRINYPMFKAIYTDFSDQPAMKGQLINTRIVSKPAVQTYSATKGADGRPEGWKTASAATTTDVNNSIDEHVGVPVVFDADTLASTVRRLFDEQAPAMSYALASYYVAKLYALCTAANFNGYAAVVAGKVPVAYATYAKGVNEFARSCVVDLNAIFNPNEVPLHDRALLLNSAYYAAVGKDPSLITWWAAQRNPEIITEGELPKMSKFVPIEAPDFPSTNNRVGIALQKNALIAISRLPNDYSKVLPGSSYGNVTQVTDAETGLTVLLVEYVNHTGGYAEMRMEVMVGAGLGDKRAGLVLTSQ